jgi:lipoyl-dependent peroxiredoxin
MSKHYAKAHWEGNLLKGKGKYTLKTSGYEGSITYTARFEDDKTASSPEELIGAAISSCFSMALANNLDKAGNTAEKVDTSAEVILVKVNDAFTITEILLKTDVKVSGLDNKKFQEIAEQTKKSCPVSRALTGTSIKLEATLV